MNFKYNDQVVNVLTGEVGRIVTTHTYPLADPKTGSLDVSVASVRFSANESTKWLVTDCLKLLGK